MTPVGEIEPMTRCRFASASPEAEFVFGACEPEFDSTASTPKAWIDYVQAQGITRVLCLLEHTQVSDHDGLLNQYRDAFGSEHVKHVPVADHRIMHKQNCQKIFSPSSETQSRIGNL